MLANSEIPTAWEGVSDFMNGYLNGTATASVARQCSGLTCKVYFFVVA